MNYIDGCSVDFDHEISSGFVIKVFLYTSKQMCLLVLRDLVETEVLVFVQIANVPLKKGWISPIIKQHMLCFCCVVRE